MPENEVIHQLSSSMNNLFIIFAADMFSLCILMPVNACERAILKFIY